MDNFKLLDSLHTKILHSKLAETITEQEINALIDCKEHDKEIRAGERTKILKEVDYLLNCGMGKQKSLEHLKKILDK